MSAAKPPMSILPMPKERIPAYFRQFTNWYAEALLEHGHGDPEKVHAEVATYLAPYLSDSGAPAGSQVFELWVDPIEEPVGATWCGSANLGFGEIFYVHDLRVHAPYRRQGHATRALAALQHFAATRNAGVGIGLSVLARHEVARSLYGTLGFEPLSHVLFKPF